MGLSQAKNYKIILTALLVGITIFSVFKYVAVLKEKSDLLKNLSQVKSQVLALEQAIEKERELEKTLSQENLGLKDELSANADKLTQLDLDLQNSQKTIEQLTTQITLSQAENTSLRQEKDRLTQELTWVSQQRDILKARLSSIPELKKAIKEARMQIPKVKPMIREITRDRRVIQGNYGFLIKDGMSTFPLPKIKIEVMPASTSE